MSVLGRMPVSQTAVRVEYWAITGVLPFGSGEGHGRPSLHADRGDGSPRVP